MIPDVCFLVHVCGLSDEQPLEEVDRGNDSNRGYSICNILPTVVPAAWLASSNSIFCVGRLVGLRHYNSDAVEICQQL